jgi:hypothetical protein
MTSEEAINGWVGCSMVKWLIGHDDGEREREREEEGRRRGGKQLNSGAGREQCMSVVL